MDAFERRMNGSAPSTPRGDVRAAVQRVLETPSTPRDIAAKKSTDTPGTGDSSRKLVRSYKKPPREGDREPGSVLAMLEKRLDSERPKALTEPRDRDRSISSIANE